MQPSTPKPTLRPGMDSILVTMSSQEELDLKAVFVNIRGLRPIDVTDNKLDAALPADSTTHDKTAEPSCLQLTRASKTDCVSFFNKRASS